MRLINSTKWPHLAFERRTPQDKPLLVIVLQGIFRVEDGRVMTALPTQPPVQLMDVFRGDPQTTSLRREGALATFKPSCDVHVDAVARSPGGEASRDWKARICVGTRIKDIQIFGPRLWEHRTGRWKLSAPEPCTEVPLAWEYAFGGAYTIDNKRVAEERNPIGTGFLPEGISTNSAIAAPQVLAPDEPMHQPGQRYIPQGCAPLGRDTAWRLKHAGTYDDAWRQLQAPCLPYDFDPRFYNSAHPDLIIEGYLRGDESIELVHLTPAGRLRAGLPGVCCEAIIHHQEGWIAMARLNLDTLHLDVASPNVEEHRAILTWRLCVPIGNGFARINVRTWRE